MSEHSGTTYRSNNSLVGKINQCLKETTEVVTSYRGKQALLWGALALGVLRLGQAEYSIFDDSRSAAFDRATTAEALGERAYDCAYRVEKRGDTTVLYLSTLSRAAEKVAIEDENATLTDRRIGAGSSIPQTISLTVNGQPRNFAVSYSQRSSGEPYATGELQRQSPGADSNYVSYVPVENLEPTDKVTDVSTVLGEITVHNGDVKRYVQPIVPCQKIGE